MDHIRRSAPLGLITSLGLTTALLACGGSSHKTETVDIARVEIVPGKTDATPVNAPPKKPGVTGMCSNALSLGAISNKKALAVATPVTPGALMNAQFDGGSGFFAVTSGAPSARIDGDDAPLELKIQGPTKRRPDQALSLKVTFTNRSDEPLTVVRPLDGSLERWRYPTYDLYALEHASNDVFRYAFVGGRCGNVNPITDEDYVTIEPGASRTDVMNGWANHVKNGLITKPGRYSIWLVYNFCGFEGDGLPLGPNKVKAAYTGVHASNEIQVVIK